jgi:hypothetical protein
MTEEAKEEVKEKTRKEENIISGMILERENVKIRSLTSKIIRASEQPNTRKKQIIGGDAELTDQDTPPAIVIEKENDKISKILVKCPCGRHAELICEYSDDEANQET